jgi:hypothetical protein
MLPPTAFARLFQCSRKHVCLYLHAYMTSNLGITAFSPAWYARATGRFQPAAPCGAYRREAPHGLAALLMPLRMLLKSFCLDCYCAGGAREANMHGHIQMLLICVQQLANGCHCQHTWLSPIHGRISLGLF